MYSPFAPRAVRHLEPRSRWGRSSARMGDLRDLDGHIGSVPSWPVSVLLPAASRRGEGEGSPQRVTHQDPATDDQPPARVAVDPGHHEGESREPERPQELQMGLLHARRGSHQDPPPSRHDPPPPPPPPPPPLPPVG